MSSDIQRLVPLAAYSWLAAAAITPAAYAAEIVGTDDGNYGDTIEIHGTRIRLWGIDAPESWWRCIAADGQEYRCGRDASNALDEWLALSLPTRCGEIDRDRYRRIVADCWRADGKSVASWLVRNRHALDWQQYSRGAYVNEERRRRKAIRHVAGRIRPALGGTEAEAEVDALSYRALKHSALADTTTKEAEGSRKPTWGP